MPLRLVSPLLFASSLGSLLTVCTLLCLFFGRCQGLTIEATETRPAPAALLLTFTGPRHIIDLDLPKGTLPPFHSAAAACGHLFCGRRLLYLAFQSPFSLCVFLPSSLFLHHREPDADALAPLCGKGGAIALGRPGKRGRGQTKADNNLLHLSSLHVLHSIVHTYYLYIPPPLFLSS